MVALRDLALVIGGAVANSGPLLFDPPAGGDGAWLDFVCGLRVVLAELGGDAGLIGAAASGGRRHDFLNAS